MTSVTWPLLSLGPQGHSRAAGIDLQTWQNRLYGYNMDGEKTTS